MDTSTLRPVDPTLLQPGDTLLWIHEKRKEYTDLDPMDNRLVHTVRVRKVTDERIVTNFGTYLHNGINVFRACGCKRFCDCWGRLYQMDETVAVN